MAEVQWLNHSGFVLRTDRGDGLIVDPWLSGRAFNDGWDLLSPSATTMAELSDCAHIWISHEHPDHFSPAALSAIPAERRRAMTVWYQATRDGRVLSFCERLGFGVREIPATGSVRIGRGIEARCAPVDNDSWLHVAVDGTTLLNMNDCGFSLAADLAAVAERLGPVDVLCTQFSYANGTVNADRPELRANLAAERLRQMGHQIGAFEPEVVVPFASFVWFCHTENAYLNDEVVTIDRAVRHIESHDARPVVLYPGDRWRVGAAHDNEAALSAYLADHGSVSTRTLVSSPAVGDVELCELAAEHGRRLRDKNSLWVLAPLRRTRYLQPVVLAVTDSDAGRFRYDMFDGLRPDRSGDPIDIEISSQSLAYCFRHEFGLNTLLVNGRFQEARPGGLTRLRLQFSPSTFNNHGWTFPAALANPRFLRSYVGRILASRRKHLA